ncbi:hypothetical protein ABIE44_000766 [Marmoricola sp. OAE513]|uniref:hypothetical protein n=1 Tax=Marmoricola sp. OAE513 TaxID=2817894 RepID=UPI001AEB9B6C
MPAPAPSLRLGPRLGTVTVLVLGALAWTGPTRADVPVGVEAVVGSVTCDAEDGSVPVTLTAGAAATDFELYLDGEPYGDEAVAVPGGTSTTITVAGLADGGHAFDVVLPGDPGADPGSDPGSDPESDPENLVSTTREVACDAAPVGAYTNPKGSVEVFCGNEAVVTATNEPIGGNTADLQPVTFTLSFQPWATDADGVGLPLDVPPTPIDTFTLDSSTPAYERVLGETEMGELAALSPTGMINLLVGDEVVSQSGLGGTCVVEAATPDATSGVALPATGA